MKKEKYIYERYYGKDTKNNKISYYEVRIRFSDGSSVAKNFRVKDFASASVAKKEAIKFRDQILFAHDSGKELFKKKTSYTVEELFNLIPDYFAPSKSTLKTYNTFYNKYIFPNFGKKNIEDVTTADILKALKQCAANCGQSHVTHLKSTIKKIYQVGGLMDLNITDKTTFVINPKSYNVTTRSRSEQNITKEDFNDFCKFFSEYGHYLPSEKQKIYERDIVLLLLKFMLITGMRPQEAKAIYRSDFDFFDEEGKTVQWENNKFNRTPSVVMIHVSRSVGSDLNNYITIKNTKTEYSARSIPFGTDCIELLQEIFLYSKYDLLFADYKGKPIGSDKLSDFLYRVRREYKNKTGKKVDIHAVLMRKAFAADLYRDGCNPVVIKELMGHKDTSMSMDWYASASTEDKLQATKNRTYKTGSFLFDK